jgi:DNA recombination protein RmuC
MWQQPINDVLPFVLIGAVPTLLIGVGMWLWARRKAVQAFANGGAARDTEVSGLEARVTSSTQSIETLEQRLNVADSEVQRLQTTYGAAQNELARLEEKSARIPSLEIQLHTTQEKAEGLRNELEAARQAAKVLETELENERKQSAEKLALLNEAKGELSNQFKSLAGEILDQKSQKFTEQNQANLMGLINPLKEQLANFDKRVVHARAEDAKERQQVRAELQQIRDLGLQLSANANDLTRALKGDAKVQGTWGEMILETVLDKSGLERGREYVIQDTKKTKDGKRVRPDVLLHLPENKVVVIDAKVSLTAYERAMNAETDEERATALAQHITSMRNHITTLSTKSYQDLIGHVSLDFVLVFVPNESAFTLALNQAPDLFDLAMERNIGLVTPNLLMVTLRTIENLWRTERQNQNALEIATQAGALYDKFVGFVAELENVGKRIEQAQEAYEGAHKKLSSGTGNLVVRTDKLKKLGAKTSKALQPTLVAVASGELPQGTDQDNGHPATGTD